MEGFSHVSGNTGQLIHDQRTHGWKCFHGFSVDSFTPLTSTPGAAILPAPCWAFGGRQHPRETDVPASWASRASRGRETTEMGNKQVTVSVSRQTGGAVDQEQGAKGVGGWEMWVQGSVNTWAQVGLLEG